jgi:hypothetical protein
MTLSPRDGSRRFAKKDRGIRRSPNFFKGSPIAIGWGMEFQRCLPGKKRFGNLATTV